MEFGDNNYFVRYSMIASDCRIQAGIRDATQKLEWSYYEVPFSRGKFVFQAP